MKTLSNTQEEALYKNWMTFLFLVICVSIFGLGISILTKDNTVETQAPSISSYNFDYGVLAELSGATVDFYQDQEDGVSVENIDQYLASRGYIVKEIIWLPNSSTLAAIVVPLVRDGYIVISIQFRLEENELKFLTILEEFFSDDPISGLYLGEHIEQGETIPFVGFTIQTEGGRISQGLALTALDYP